MSGIIYWRPTEKIVNKPKTPLAELSIKAGDTIRRLAELDPVSDDICSYFKDNAGRPSDRNTTTQTELLTVDRQRYPEIFMDAFDNLKSEHYMGIFENIGYVWRTVDHSLFLWNYIQSSKVLTYDGQDQPITAVGSVKHFSGFSEVEAGCFLVIATPVQVMLLGITKVVSQNIGKTGTAGIISLGVNIPTDDMCFIEIHDTDDGRILLLGTDGHIYELCHPGTGYNDIRKGRLVCLTKSAFSKLLPSPFGWAVRGGFVQTIVNNQRQLIYALTDNNSIEVLSVKKRGESAIKLLKTANLLQEASGACYQNGITFNPKNFEIKSIHLIEKESQKFHLLAVSTTGTRIYYTHLSGVLSETPLALDLLPTVLRIAHVISPPSQYQQDNYFMTLQDIQDQQDPLQLAFYNNALFLTAKGALASENTISATAIEPIVKNALQGDTSATTSAYVETTAYMEHHETLYAIGEIHPKFLKKTEQDLPTSIRQFVLVGHKGITVVVREKPVDTLCRLLDKTLSNKVKSVELDIFFNYYGYAQACAMCLEIACGNFEVLGQDKEALIQKASSAFSEYGGQPISTSVVSTRESYTSEVDLSSRTKYSVKHDSLGLYLVQLMRPTWRKIIFPLGADNKFANDYTALCIELDILVQRLCALRLFMKGNDLLRMIPEDFIPGAYDSNTKMWIFDERMSFNEISTLITQTVETVSFLKMLMESGVQETYQELQGPYKEYFTRMDIESLVTTQEGHQLLRELVYTIIHIRSIRTLCIGRESVSTVLQKSNDTLFSAEDIVFYKAIEIMKKARPTDSTAEKERLLAQVLDYLEKAPENLVVDKIESICQNFCQLGWYKGVLDLAISHANKADPSRNAMLFLENGSNESSSQKNSYQARYNYYVQVIKTFNYLLPSSSGTVEIRLYPKTKHLFEAAIAQQDVIFLYVFYDWLFKNNLYEDLYSIESEHFTHFVRNYVEIIQGTRFLYTYHARREQRFEAAFYLEACARLDPTAELDQRLSYLGHALYHLRMYLLHNSLHSSEARNFIKQVESQMKALRIQSEMTRWFSSAHALSERDKALLRYIPMSLEEMLQLCQRYNDSESADTIMKLTHDD
ncbi:Nup133 N terminal like-domain-containing protein [Spinellus fusiger]|nr:Nup133 N terminal like-domain-containing protein [Spinellus fusiger]